MTKVTKLTLFTSIMLTSFALGMVFQSYSRQPLAFGDSDSHWGHSGSNIFTVPANANVGIRTNNPEKPLHVSSNGSNMAAIFDEFRDVDASAPFFVLRKAKGSQASPAAVAAGGSLGTFAFRGWDGNGDYKDAARIVSEAEGSVGDNRVPGRLLFQTATDAAGSRLVERMRINSAGNVGIGTSAPSQRLHVAGSINLTGNGTQRIISDGELCIGSGC